MGSMCFYCQQYLQAAREMAKAREIEIPRFTRALKGGLKSGGEPHYFIEFKDKPGVAFDGWACCAYMARAKAIDAIIARHGELNTRIERITLKAQFDKGRLTYQQLDDLFVVLEKIDKIKGRDSTEDGAFDLGFHESEYLDLKKAFMGK